MLVWLCFMHFADEIKVVQQLNLSDEPTSFEVQTTLRWQGLPLQIEGAMVMDNTTAAHRTTF